MNDMTYFELHLTDKDIAVIVDNRRVFGPDPETMQGLPVKNLTLHINRRKLLAALEAGELHPPPQTSIRYVNFLDPTDVEALKDGQNDRELDAYASRMAVRQHAELADWLDNIDAAVFSGDTFEHKENETLLYEFMDRWQRHFKFIFLPSPAKRVLIPADVAQKGDLTDAAKDALAAGCVIWPTSCTCGGQYAWLTPKRGAYEMYGCICHNEPPVVDAVNDQRTYEAVTVEGEVHAYFKDPKTYEAFIGKETDFAHVPGRPMTPPQRFALGHLQAIYEHFFNNQAPRPEDLKQDTPGEIGYIMMIQAYWHGRQGGRRVDGPGIFQKTCAAAAYQAGYDTGVRGEYLPPDNLIAAILEGNSILNDLPFEKRR